MRKSKLSQAKQHKLIEHFVAGTTTRCVADLIDVNRKTAAHYYYRLRAIIADQLEKESSRLFSNEIILKESYFGSHARKNRGRFKTEKILISLILKENKTLYIKIIADAIPEALQSIVDSKRKISRDLNEGDWHEYNVFDVSSYECYPVTFPLLLKDKKNNKKIANFWCKSKRHLRKFNGIPRDRFELFFKECEWRFNNPTPKSQFIQLKQWIKQEAG